MTLSLESGQRVLLGDGVGRPSALSSALSAAARAAGDVSLILGFVVAPDPGLELDAFADVRTFMSGWGLRNDIDAGRVRYVPARLGAVPALITSSLRPDVVVVSVVETPRGLTLGSEVSIMRVASAVGARVVGVLRPGIPACDAGPALKGVEIVAEDETPPIIVPTPRCTPEHLAIAELIAPLVPSGARLQVGPGPLAAAVLSRLERPVTIDAGMLVDGIVDLDQRGLLAGAPHATYLCGSEKLYDWAHGRPILHGTDMSHDQGRLIGHGPFVSVNTALQIDVDGNVNVECVDDSAVGGIGGHPDYTFAGSSSVGGLSIVAVPSYHAGRPVLVDRLSCPPSSPGHDVDIIVNERGVADLRGLDRHERRTALINLWDGDPMFEGAMLGETGHHDREVATR